MGTRAGATAAQNTDFGLMYSDTASRIRAASAGNPKLFFCEGLSYASDLTKAGTQPITGGDIVYAAARLQLVPPGRACPSPITTRRWMPAAATS